MKKTILHSSCTLLLLLGLPSGGFAAEATPKAEPEVQAGKGEAKVPYHGKVAAVDAAAKTFSIKGKDRERVFMVTNSTKITRDGAVAELSSIAAGEEVRGQASRSGDKWQAVSIMAGGKTTTKASKKEEKVEAKQ